MKSDCSIPFLQVREVCAVQNSLLFFMNKQCRVPKEQGGGKVSTCIMLSFVTALRLKLIYSPLWQELLLLPQQWVGS